jgi:hypothetical protein
MLGRRLIASIPLNASGDAPAQEEATALSWRNPAIANPISNAMMVN